LCDIFAKMNKNTLFLRKGRIKICLTHQIKFRRSSKSNRCGRKI